MITWWEACARANGRCPCHSCGSMGACGSGIRAFLNESGLPTVDVVAGARPLDAQRAPKTEGEP